MTEMVITHSCTKDRKLPPHVSTCASLNSFEYIVQCIKIHWTEFIASRIIYTQPDWNMIHLQSMSSPWISYRFIRIPRYAFERVLHSNNVVRLLYQVEMMKRFLELGSFKYIEITNRVKDKSVRQQQPSVALELSARRKWQWCAHKAIVFSHTS